MKILYYCPEYYSRHGGRTHARGFFNALSGLASVSECYIYPKSDPSSVTPNIKSVKVPRDKLWFLPLIVRDIIRYFSPKRKLTQILVQEIITNGCDAVVIRTGAKQPIIAQIKSRCPGVTVCLEINAADFDESFQGLLFRGFFQRWEVMRDNQADAMVVVSSYLKDYLVRHGVSPLKILVNQNGVDGEAVSYSEPGDVRKRYGIPVNAFVIGYVGGMEPFRRIPEIIQYIAELRQAGNNDVYFFIIGDGHDMPAIEAAIESRRDALSNTVKLSGWQEHSEVGKFLSAFDIAIFPFTNDYCSPLKLFEYLAAGVPTIGPDTSAVREVFVDGVHLMLVKNDGSDFISTVLYLKGNPKIREKLSQNGQQLVLRNYTWKKNAERVLAHIKKTRND